MDARGWRLSVQAAGQAPAVTAVTRSPTATESDLPETTRVVTRGTWTAHLLNSMRSAGEMTCLCEQGEHCIP